jgi:cytochrome c oxidase subunit II
MNALPFWPPAASAYAEVVDRLVISFSALIIALALPVFVLIFVFAVRYRRGQRVNRRSRESGNLWIEISWSVIPFVLTLVFFVQSSVLYAQQARPPADALKVDVVGKQWMWKFQHLDGQREINELHVPVGRAVKLIMTSEDVIHDVFVPAFRVKADVLPGRYTNLWFQATTPGRYRLFCAEYCGTRHSGMTGEVIVMEPTEYQAWLSGGSGEGSLASGGEKLFQDLACNTCHRPDAQGRGPVLQGLFGKTQTLLSGETIVVDEAYVRESILNPGAKITAGFQPIMPAFQGLVSEEQLLQLIEYVKSLQTQPQGQSK